MVGQILATIAESMPLRIAKLSVSHPAKHNLISAELQTVIAISPSRIGNDLIRNLLGKRHRAVVIQWLTFDSRVRYTMFEEHLLC